MNSLKMIQTFHNLDERSFPKLLLYGDSKYENKVSKKIILY